ncbi:substrate-binding domain-containing protein [Catenulispora subtropica]|uniref:LacI family DNA-binding transcriptional regulator n=1 Tax=Catenulispora subtropica TaxID=450798 RepID=A0ABP5D348_9ACTN
MTETPDSAEPADIALGMVWDADSATAGRRSPLQVDVFVGVRRHLSAHGADLVLLAAARPEDGVDAYVHAAHRHGLDGVLVLGVDEGHPALTALTASGLPCVAVDLPIYRNQTTYVASDNRAGAVSAVEHLRALGHRAIATITGPLSLMPAVERLVGYRFEMARAGLPVRPEYVVSGEYTQESGYACAQRLLSLQEPPTAVFAADDRMAVGVIRALADAGVAVPGEVSVVGFDDVEAAALVRPGLTTVAQDHAAIGEGAVELLLRTIRGEAPDGADGDDRTRERRAAEPLLVPTRLVVRESCGPVAGS